MLTAAHPVRCPRCSGPLFDSTVHGEIAEAGPSLSCLLCGELLYTAPPPRPPSNRLDFRGRPGRPRKGVRRD
jgi:hypothetical protein